MDALAAASPLRDALLVEHTAVDALLGDVIDTLGHPEDDRRMTTWTRFADALVAHLDAEDDLVTAMPYERGVRVLVQEHRYIRARLAELSEAARKSHIDPSSLRKFRDILRAHSRNDDRLLYRWAEDSLDAVRRTVVLEALARRMRGIRSAPTSAEVANG